MTTIPSMTLSEIADMFDAAIITDPEGRVAFLSRIYDEDSVPVVRYHPDPCDFRRVEWWETATIEQISRAVC